MLVFDVSEYKSRVARTKAAMAARGIEVLLVASPANQFWLTGYDGWSFYTPQMVVVAADRDEPVWIGRKMDAAGARFTAYLAPENVVPYPDDYVGSDTLHPMDFVADRVLDMGLGGCVLGVETDDYYYTARWDHILRRRLPEATFEDAFLLVNRCRMVKSDRELTYMRQAGQIAAAAQQAAYEAAAPGVRQCDVMAEVYRVTTAGLPGFGGTFPCKPPNAMVGEMCSAPHLSWTDAPLAEGEIFYIELGGIRHRYHSPLSRCIHLGPPPDALRRLADGIAEGLQAVLDTVRAGATCADLTAAWQRVARSHGVEKDSRIGYPVGIGYPPTWGELTASLRSGDDTVLEPGMTFHCIPAIWREHDGVVISETFAVTETGAEIFADCPRTLFVKS